MKIYKFNFDFCSYNLLKSKSRWGHPQSNQLLHEVKQVWPICAVEN